MKKILRFIVSSIITLIELIKTILLSEFAKDLLNILNITVVMIKSVINSKVFIDSLLFALWMIGLYFAYFLGNKFIINNYDIKTTTSFVILLSSFIASLSMLKSIKHSDEQKKFDKINVLSSEIEKYVKEIIDICEDNYYKRNIDSTEYDKILINLDYSISRLKFLMSEYHEVTWGLKNHLFDDFPTIVKMKIEKFIEGTLKLMPIVQDTLDDWSDLNIESEKEDIKNNLIKHRDLIYKQYKEIIDI